MALIFMEGFDKYGLPNGNLSVTPGPADLIAQGDWNTYATLSGNTIVSGLSATGGALQHTGLASITKTLPSNFSRLIGGVRFSFNLGGTTGCGIQFYDGATAQCGIQIASTTGVINVRNGAYASGTILATSAATVSAGSVHYLEWDFTFTNTGAYQVWLDGVSIISGTGDLTGTANNYVNAFALGAGSASTNVVWDDLYLFDTTGSTNNAVLLTSPRVETTFPVSDSAVQFAFGAATFGGSTPRGITYNPAVNTWYVRPITPTQNCTLVSLSVYGGTQSNATINMRPIVYADSAGVPGALLTSGPTVVGMSIGTRLMSLTTPQSLVAGTRYWIGFMSDIAGGGNIMSLADSLAQGRTAVVTFASGAPGTAPGGQTLGLGTVNIWGNVTGVTNAYIAGGNSQPLYGPPLPGQNYVFDATVGHEDLYNFNAFSQPPLTIYAVAVKAYAQKSDSGTRTVSMRTKSGSTDSPGSLAGQVLGTSFGWYSSYFPTDPNTGAAWTASALNAATSGFKIDA